MSSEAIFYVYALLDPRKPGVYTYGPFTLGAEPFYIGKGHGARAKAHFEPNSLAAHNTFKNNVIRKILQEDLEPEIVYLKTGMFEDDAFKLECKLISKIGRRSEQTGCLTNLTDGGEGFSGYVLTDEDREKLRLSGLRRWSNMTKDQRASISRKVSATVVARTVKEKRNFSQTLSDNWAKKSDIEMQEIAAKRAKSKRLSWLNTSDEDKARISSKLSLAWSKNPEKRKAALRAGHRRKTPMQKALHVARTQISRPNINIERKMFWKQVLPLLEQHLSQLEARA